MHFRQITLIFFNADKHQLSGDEIDNSVRDDARLRADLNRGFFSGVPFTLSGDEMARDFDAGNICEGVQLFGLCCVVHGWNKTGFSGKLDDSALGRCAVNAAVIHHKLAVNLAGVFRQVARIT